MTYSGFNHTIVEEKWRKRWLEGKYYQPTQRFAANTASSDKSTVASDQSKPPFYNLMMFPYPSAEGLHVGNMYAFTGADVYGRYMRMRGYDVFEPIGLDGFGIHSENYALKIGKHPKEQAKVSERRFYDQLLKIGDGFAWDYRLETYDEDYYKWTQWLFVEMFKRGLAYRKNARVNWCPNCKTVLADEQVLQKSQEPPLRQGFEGQAESKISKSSKKENLQTDKEITVAVCERCDTEVTYKDLAQWFFTITDYADRLLEDIDGLEWPEKIKTAQRQWIGRSKGLLIGFKISTDVKAMSDKQNSKFENKHIAVWTKFWETVFGTTYLVVAPEHPIVDELLNSKYEILNAKKMEEIREYVEKAKAKTEQQRKAEEKVKTGVDTGVKVINPVNGKPVPLWVADYALMDVGTGAVMGVPMHDSRDWQFAKKFNLPLIEVVEPVEKSKFQNPNSKQTLHSQSQSTNFEQPYEGEGMLVNSAQFSGMNSWGEGKEKMAEWMIEEGYASWHDHYHLRDWLISRQRYWGPPIPMIHCVECEKKGRSWFNANPVQDSQNSKFHKTNSKQISNSTDQNTNKPQWESAGWYPVEDLPVKLPDLDDWKPKGEGRGPLENASDDWLFTKCPSCGGKAKRETDVSDTFLDSSWYFLAYPNLKTAQWQQFPNGNRSYLMGGADITDTELEALGIRVVERTEKGDRKIEIPKRALADYEKLVTAKLGNGYWNEYIGEKVVFIFKTNDGEVERIVLNTQTHDRINELAHEFNGQGWTDKKTVWDWLADEPFYTQLIRQHQATGVGVPVPWDNEIIKQWLPVNAYIGGAEHAVLHLLYARFVWKALCDWGYLPFLAVAENGNNGEIPDRLASNSRQAVEDDKPGTESLPGLSNNKVYRPEPFPFLYGHGLIIKDGAKMSKSRGNVVNPDEYIKKYGADALRVYLMFLGPFNQGGDFSDSGMQGARRFLDRVWRMMTDGHYLGSTTPKVLTSLLNETVAKVDTDMREFKFNTAIAKIMEFVNAWRESGPIRREDMQVVIKMLAPLAPYMAEELWQRLQATRDKPQANDKNHTVHYQQYPESDDTAIAAKDLVVMVQVDGKVRSMLTFKPGTLLTEAQVLTAATNDVKAFKWLDGKEVVKTVFVPPLLKRQGMLAIVTG